MLIEPPITRVGTPPERTRNELLAIVALCEFALSGAPRPTDEDLGLIGLEPDQIAEPASLAVRRWARIFSRTVAELRQLAEDLSDPRTARRWTGDDQKRVDHATAAVLDGLRTWLEVPD